MEIKEYLEKAYKLETEYLKHYYAKDLIEDEIENLRLEILEIEHTKDENIKKKRNELIRKHDYYSKYRPILFEPTRTYEWENKKDKVSTNRNVVVIAVNVYMLIFIFGTINNPPVSSIAAFILIVANLIIYIYFSWELEKMDKRIQEEEKDYKKRLREYKKDLKKYKNRDIDHTMKLETEFRTFVKKTNKEADKKINVIKEDMIKLRELKKKESTKLTASKKKLKTFYESDIIFEKYKNICAISSFLEHYESERTDALTGQNGAYNIYENEVSNKSAMKSFYFDHSKPYSNYSDAQYYLKIVIEKLNSYINNIKKEMQELTK